ncbi:MAG: TIGR00282 family metallophosphoesterase [Candidatus Zixiibacteriota bacterium]|nr:MAG: TIGR00282 family metallophosphoesterase [candidate division Zixibacteria bacterium]
MTPFTILFIADICGKAGRQAAAHLTKPLRERFQADYVIANVENAAGGFGITTEMSRKIFSYGVDVQTSGNHIWDRMDIVKYLDTRPRLLRPANYPPTAPGMGSFIDSVDDVKIGILNLMGRTYMKDIDCPFKVADRELTAMRKHTNVIFVDFHAEATSEKQALTYYLDGLVSAIIGTHTHVQTADEKITRRGTAYITDAGMTGPHESVIGMEVKPSVERFLTGMPIRFSTASEDVKISGVVVKIDRQTGEALSIERFKEDFDLEAFQNKNHNDEPED